MIDSIHDCEYVSLRQSLLVLSLNQGAGCHVRIILLAVLHLTHSELL